MRILPLLPLLLLPLAACSPAPADIPQEAPGAPVRVETVRWEPFQPTLTVLGVVRPAGIAEVAAPVSGRLGYPGRFAGGLANGAEVRAGEVLARLSSPEAEAELAEARLRVDLTASELARHRRAFEAGVEAEAVLAAYQAEAELARSRLEAARGRAARLDLRAPTAGRLIVERRIPPGSDVAPGTVLARIAAGGALTVEGRAAAADRPLLRPGLPARFALSGAAPGSAGRGVVREVSPLVEAGGTVALTLEVTAPEGLPAPGEGVEIHLGLAPRPQALTVPEEALVVGEGGHAMFVVERQAGRVARRRPVVLGQRGIGGHRGRVEVLSGLDPGMKVVVDGASLLEDGARVVVVESAEGTR